MVMVSDGEDMQKKGRWKVVYRWLVVIVGIGFLVLTGGIQGSESCF